MVTLGELVEAYMDFAVREDLRSDMFPITLGRDDGPSVVVFPGLAARIGDCSLTGLEGEGIGYHNMQALKRGLSGNPQFRGDFGGIARLWVSPEPSNCFEPGTPRNFPSWVAKPQFDLARYSPEIVWRKDGVPTKVKMRATVPIDWMNYHSKPMSLLPTRTVELLEDPLQHNEEYGKYVTNGTIKVVSYRDTVKAMNVGCDEISVGNSNMAALWILGQFPVNKVWLAPVEEGSDEQLGPSFVDYHFSNGEPMRQSHVSVDNGIFGKILDARFREKWGIPKKRFKGRVGYFDPVNNELVVYRYEADKSSEAEVLQQNWKDAPANRAEYAGKIFNPKGGIVDGYNDGPVEKGGKCLGGFCEVELLQPGREIKRGGSMKISYTVSRYQCNDLGLLFKIAKLPEVFGADIAQHRFIKEYRPELGGR